MQLSLKPITSTQPSQTNMSLSHQLSDTRIRVMSSVNAVVLASVTPGFQLGVQSAAADEPWSLITVSIGASVESEDVARLNRLLSGTGLPRLEWYHRTNSLSLRLPGRAASIPAYIVARYDAMSPGRWSYDVYEQGDARFRDDGLPWPGTTPQSTKSATAQVAAHMTAGVPPTPPAPVQQAVGAAIAARAAMMGGAGTLAAEDQTAADLAASIAARGAQPQTIAAVIADPQPVLGAHTAEGDSLGIFVFPDRATTPDIEVPPETRSVLNAAWSQHVKGQRQVGLIGGPTGTGKTSLVYDLASRVNVGVFQYDAAGAATFIDWVGSTAVLARDGVMVTEWQPSAFIEAVRLDGAYKGIPRIVFVDEVNRAESAAATNFLMSITHGVGRIYIPDARRSITIDPAAFIVYTANIGSQYNATVPLDPALMDRIDWTLWLEYPPEQVEIGIVTKRTGVSREIAARLVAAARQVRVVADRGDLELGISPRRVIAAAGKVMAGLTAHQAAVYCWANSYSAEGGSKSDRQTVRNTIDASLRGV